MLAMDLPILTRGAQRIARTSCAKVPVLLEATSEMPVGSIDGA